MAQCPECGTATRVPPPETPIPSSSQANATAAPSPALFGLAALEMELRDTAFEDKKRVAKPATCLMVLAAKAIFVELFLVGMIAYNLAFHKHFIFDRFTLSVVILLGICLMSVQGLIFLGGLKMSHMQNYRMAVASSILALVPGVSPFLLLGIPFGIWSLVVLNNPEVRNAFRS
jgi:hypothetical protein